MQGLTQQILDGACISKEIPSQADAVCPKFIP